MGNTAQFSLPAISGFSDRGFYSATNFAPGNATAFTAFVLALVRATVGTSVEHIVGNYDDATNKGWRIYFDNATGAICADIGRGVSGKTTIVNASAQAPVGGHWAFCQLAYDSNTGVAGLYVNGRLTTATLAQAHVPNAGGTYALGYDVNNSKDEATFTSIALVGYGNVAPALEASQAFLVLCESGGQIPATFLDTIILPGGIAWRTMFDNDGFHPPPPPPASPYGPGKLAWPPYFGSGVALARTGSVGAANVPGTLG